MTHDTRRDFNRKLLGSVTAYALIETLYHRDLFADAVKPVVGQWMADLNTLCKDVKEQKIKDVDFQAKLEELYKKADLPELIKLLDLDKIAGKTKLPDNGAASIGLDLSKVEGLGKIVFGRQIFGLKKGRSIVPHGHDNMCTGFIILARRLRGPALRPRRGQQGPLPHQADHRPHIQTRRVLDDLRPQGQRPLVQVRLGNGLRVQHPRDELQPGEQEEPEPHLHRPGRREDVERADRGEEDIVGGVPSEVWVRG